MAQYYVHSTNIVGYTHSDGYCLCVEHGTDTQGNELPDPGNETGKVFPIFAGDETDTDLICDVCLSKAIANGADPHTAIILAANIDSGEEAEPEGDFL